jgi:Flp pilus assembly pilin Flp
MEQHTAHNRERRSALVAFGVALVLASFSGLAPDRRAGRGDQGATATEYALMAAFIAVVIVVSVTLFGRNVSGLFQVPASVFQP